MVTNMKKSYFNKRGMALLTTMALLVSLFTFATPVSADTLNTYTENFDNYDAENATTTWTYTAGYADKRPDFPGTATVETDANGNDKALKVYSGEYSATAYNYGADSDILKITAPGVDKNSELVEISFTFRKDGDSKWPFSKFAHIGAYSRSGYTSTRGSNVQLKWNSTSLAYLDTTDLYNFKYVYDLRDYTVDIYAGTDSLSLKGENLPWADTTSSSYDTIVADIKAALLADNISVIFAAYTDQTGDTSTDGWNWAVGSSYTYWIDDLKVVGAKAPVTGLKEYSQDFESYGDYDSIAYSYTLGAADNGGTASIENFDTDNKALKIVSKNSTTTNRDKLKISMPGMPDDANLIEVYFNFCVDGDGKRPFFNFASTQDNNNHLRASAGATVGLYRSGWKNELVLSKYNKLWLKVRQVYNLKDNTFSVYYGDNYENTWVSNDTANKTNEWVSSLTGETINLWFGTNNANSWGGGDALTYWIDDVKIVGSTLPAEVLYNEDGTELYTGTITGGTTVTVKVSGTDVYTDFAGFAALKNKDTGKMEDIELYTPSDLTDGAEAIQLTAPEGDGTYIVEIYYLDSLTKLTPLSNKVTLGNVES